MGLHLALGCIARHSFLTATVLGKYRRIHVIINTCSCSPMLVILPLNVSRASLTQKIVALRYSLILRHLPSPSASAFNPPAQSNSNPVLRQPLHIRQLQTSRPQQLQITKSTPIRDSPHPHAYVFHPAQQPPLPALHHHDNNTGDEARPSNLDQQAPPAGALAAARPRKGILYQYHDDGDLADRAPRPGLG